MREGSEEYMDSEKYEAKERALDGPMLPYIQRMNQIRRENPALQHLSNVAWLDTYNDQVMAYLKQHGSNVIICAVNLDPHNAQEASVVVPDASRPAARTSRSGTCSRARRSHGTPGGNYVRLDPWTRQAHVLHVESL